MMQRSSLQMDKLVSIVKLRFIRLVVHAMPIKFGRVLVCFKQISNLVSRAGLSSHHSSIYEFWKALKAL